MQARGTRRIHRPTKNSRNTAFRLELSLDFYLRSKISNDCTRLRNLQSSSSTTVNSKIFCVVASVLFDFSILHDIRPLWSTILVYGFAQAKDVLYYLLKCATDCQKSFPILRFSFSVLKDISLQQMPDMITAILSMIVVLIDQYDFTEVDVTNSRS